jgi:rhamnogalacturonyl hydrolase YesR
LGLTQYAISKKKPEIISEVTFEFDKFIDLNGKPNFNLDKVDQVPFGLTSLLLYNFNNDEKYLKFADEIFSFIKDQIDNKQVVCYRSNIKVYFYDTLGMVVPFLVEYYKIVNSSEALSIARHQLWYYITNNGINKDNFLPFHGILRESSIQIGSSNWGRGIGWYLLGLSSFHKVTGEFELEFAGLLKTLNTLKNSEGLWSQFPGSSNFFDASATTMIMYSMKNVDSNQFKNEEVLKLLKKYIAYDGSLLQTSGDTYSLNNYSKSFGKSELSQGLFLLILSMD